MDTPRLKGTYDILPRESDFYQILEETFVRVLNSYGYKKIVFPVIEYAGLFQRGVGESSDIVVKKEMYVFEDRGKRLIALRPEGTASAVRLYLENSLGMQGYAARLYYIGPMFRAENPQAGRFRQFVQFGVEYLGDPTPEADAELIQINADLFGSLGLTDLTFFINSIGCRDCRPKYLETLKAYFQPHLSGMCPDCQKRAETNVMRILDCKEEACKTIAAKSPAMLDHLCDVCAPHFETVKERLTGMGIPYQIDQRLVRGLDYYNRTVFEIKSGVLGSQSTVSAGGRYDYLVKELGGMETPAAGFALGMERLAMVVEAVKNQKKTDFYQAPSIYVAGIGDEMRAHIPGILAAIRKAGVSCTTEYRHTQLKKHLKSADSAGIPYLLMAGGDELASGQFTLRNLASGEQKTGSIQELAASVKA